MRKYIFNGAIIGSVIGGWQALQMTRHGPRDWRLALTWVGWAASLAVAIGNVAYDASGAEDSNGDGK